MNNKIGFVNELNPDNGIPLHIQIREIIRREITNGDLIEKNGKVFTEQILTQRFQVSRVTIRKAIENLVNEGMLIRKRGQGTFIKSNKSEAWVGQLMGFTETIQEEGYHPGAKILTNEVAQNPRQQIKDRLQQSNVHVLKRIRFADRTPIAIEEAFFPVNIGEQIQKENLEEIAMYRFFEEHLNTPIEKAEQIISATNADKQEATHLNIIENDALIYIERLSYTREKKPIEFLRATYLPEYFQYTIQLSRELR